MIRKIHLFCLFFLLLLFIGAVSANDDSNISNSVSTNGVSLETHDVNMFYKDGTSFDVKLVDNKKAISGGKINITVNGVTYSRTTNSSGLAKLNLNLCPGDYKIKTDSIFNNQKLSVINNIKIKEMNTSLIADKVVDLGYKEGKYNITLIGGNNKYLSGKTVTFSINGVDYTRTTDENGRVGLNINLNPGSYQISVKFSENFYKDAYVSSIINVGIFNTRFISNPAKFNKTSVEYSVKLVDSRNHVVKNGLVIFKVNQITKIVLTDDNGVAIFKADLNPGVYNVIFEFGGNIGYLKSSDSNTIEVIVKEIIIKSQDFETCVDSPIPYLISVTDSDNTKLINVTVKTDVYKDNKLIKTIQSRTYEDGVARVIFDLNPGEYKVKNYLTSSGVYNYNTVIIKPASIEVISSDLVFNRKGEYYKVTLINNETKNPIANQSLVISINGVSYKRVTNENGTAKLQINLNNGNYEISYYTNDISKYPSVKGSNRISIVNKLLSPDFEVLSSEIIRKGTYFQVRMVDVNGAPLVGKEIHISVNNVAYKRITDNEGMAKLKINLMDGNYVIRVYFAGDDLLTRCIKTEDIKVNTVPNFSYSLNIDSNVNYNGYSAPFIREFTIVYNNVEYDLDYFSDRNCPKITQKNSYFISADGLQSSNNGKQGIEFKYVNGFILLTFYGRTYDIGQFSVIFSSKKENTAQIDYVIDNEVVATVCVSSFYGEDDYNKLIALGYTFLDVDKANSTFKYSDKEIIREVQLKSSNYGMYLKNSPTFEDFDTIQSYLITSKKISDSVMENKVNKAIYFNQNYPKEAYEIYLSALMTMWAADSSADKIASELKVSWNKKNQVIFANWDWSQLSLDSHPSIEVSGTEENVKTFYTYYGLLFSLCEEFGLQTIGNNASSAVHNIFDGIYNGKNFLIDKKDEELTLKIVNSSDKIVINTKTGELSAYIAPNIDYITQNFLLKGSITSQYTSIAPNIESVFGYALNRFQDDFSGFLNTISHFSIKPNILLKQSLDSTSSLVPVAIALKTGAATVPYLVIQAGIGFQQYTLNFRNKYVSDDNWQYYSSHGSIEDIRTIAIVNPNTHYTDYIEIPYEGKNLNIEKGIYIDSVTGKRNLTESEKNEYATYK